MSGSAIERVARRAAVAVAAAAAALAMGAGSAGAYEACPKDWNEVDTGGRELSGVLQFCSKDVSSVPLANDAYVFKVPADRVTQGYEFMTPGEQESNPWLRLEPVPNWLILKRLAGEPYSLAVNGTFFDPEDEPQPEMGRSSFPFLTKEPIGSISSLIATGKHPDDETFAESRRCISWLRGARANVRDSVWTLGSDDGPSIVGRLSSAGGACSLSADGDVPANGEFVVGFDPRQEINGSQDALLLVGVTTSGNGMWNTDKLCFLVGGYQLRSVGSDILLDEFGCKPVLQLDGGRSVQMSYTDPTTGEIETIIEGERGEYNRPVPHVMLIR